MKVHIVFVCILVGAFLFALGVQARDDQTRDEKREELEHAVSSKRLFLKEKMLQLFTSYTPGSRQHLLEARLTGATLRRVQERLEEEKTEFLGRGDQRRSLLAARFGERRAENIEDYFERMVEKFEAALERLADFEDRIRIKLDRMSARGYDVSGVEERFLLAEASLESSAEALENARGAYEEAVASDNFKESFEHVREAVSELKDNIKTSHEFLVSIVEDMNALEMASSTLPFEVSTSTATTTP